MAEFYSKKKKPLNFDFPSGSKTMEGNSNGSPVTVVPSGYKLSPSEAPVAPVKVQTKSISLNIKKGGPDARKSTLKACNDGAQSGSVQDNTGTSPPNVDKLFTFHIPSYMCGKFIGKRGWRIQMIRQQSGAKIRLQDLPFTPEIKTCVIIGSKNSIETAWCIIKKELPTIHLPGVDRTPAAIPVIMPENMQSVKMENNVEKNTSRYRVKTPYENFQITSGFNDRDNFDGRLGSTSSSLPIQLDLYAPSDDFGQTVPLEYDQGTSQYGQSGTLYGNYQQEQQSPNNQSLPPKDFSNNQDEVESKERQISDLTKENSVLKTKFQQSTKAKKETKAEKGVQGKPAAPRPYSSSHLSRRSLPELEIKDQILKRLEETFREIELKQDKLAAIMFVDLDNFNFFEKLPKDIHLPENLYVVGFNGGDQTWRPSESEAYHQHKQKGLFSLVLSGTEKDAADKDLKELARSIDSTISQKITFFILSGDGGFFKFLQTANRHVEIQNPHKTSVKEHLYDVVLNHMKP